MPDPDTSSSASAAKSSNSSSRRLISSRFRRLRLPYSQSSTSLPPPSSIEGLDAGVPLASGLSDSKRFGSSNRLISEPYPKGDNGVSLPNINDGFDFADPGGLSSSVPRDPSGQAFARRGSATVASGGSVVPVMRAAYGELTSSASPTDHPRLVRLAYRGDLAAATRIVELARSESKTAREYAKAVNGSAVRSHRPALDEDEDYVKTRLYHHDTPLIAAARNGHDDVVKMLLSTEVADPTLQSHPCDGQVHTASGASRQMLVILKGFVRGVCKREQIRQKSGGAEGEGEEAHSHHWEVFCKYRPLDLTGGSDELNYDESKGAGELGGKYPAVATEEELVVFSNDRAAELASSVRRYANTRAMLDVAEKCWDDVRYSTYEADGPFSGARNFFTNAAHLDQFQVDESGAEEEATDEGTVTTFDPSILDRNNSLDIDSDFRSRYSALVFDGKASSGHTPSGGGRLYKAIEAEVRAKVDGGKPLFGSRMSVEDVRQTLAAAILRYNADLFGVALTSHGREGEYTRDDPMDLPHIHRLQLGNVQRYETQLIAPIGERVGSLPPAPPPGGLVAESFNPSLSAPTGQQSQSLMKRGSAKLVAFGRSKRRDKSKTSKANNPQCPPVAEFQEANPWSDESSCESSHDREETATMGGIDGNGEGGPVSSHHRFEENEEPHTTDGFDELVFRVSQNDPTLTKLNLDGRTDLNGSRWDSLFGSLEQNVTVKVVSARRCKIDDDGAFPLTVCILGNSTIQELDLRDNMLTNAFAEGLAKVLEASADSPLSKLRLNGNKGIDREVTERLDALMMDKASSGKPKSGSHFGLPSRG